MSKPLNVKITIDDILGPNVDNISQNSKHANNINNKGNNVDNVNTVDISIDNILNNGLLDFDNKNQTSMFFVTYKSLDVIYKELYEKYNFTIPKE